MYKEGKKQITCFSCLFDPKLTEKRLAALTVDTIVIDESEHSEDARNENNEHLLAIREEDDLDDDDISELLNNENIGEIQEKVRGWVTEAVK